MLPQDKRTSITAVAGVIGLEESMPGLSEVMTRVHNRGHVAQSITILSYI